MKSLSLVLVLMFSNFVHAESGFRSALISTLSGTTRTPQGSTELTRFQAEVNVDLSEDLRSTLKLPLLMGDQNAKHFRELGNPYIGLELDALNLSNEKPFLMKIKGASRFARSESEISAAAKYDEYHGGLGLEKTFSDSKIYVEGLYVSKLNEAKSGEDVGDELRGQAGVDIVPMGRLRTHLGYVWRRAEGYKYQGALVSPAVQFNAIEAGAAYRIDTGIYLGINATIGIGKKLEQVDRIAFGDPATQLETQDGVSIGFMAEL